MSTLGTDPKPRVGAGVFVLKSKQDPRENPSFLIGERINAHGAGTLALPGGHLEYGETPQSCAARELMEETGLKATNVRFLTATNDIMHADQKHYVTLFMVCEREDEEAEPQVLEPDKCKKWEWATWEELLEWVKRENEAREKGEVAEKRLFTPLVNLIDQRPGVMPTGV